MHTEIHRPFPLRNWRALAIGNRYSYITLALYLNLLWAWCWPLLRMCTCLHSDIVGDPVFQTPRTPIIHLYACLHDFLNSLPRILCLCSTGSTYRGKSRFQAPRTFICFLQWMTQSCKSQHAGSVAFRLNHYFLPSIHPSIHTDIHADRHTWHTWHTDIHIYNIIQLLSVIHRHV